MFIEAPSAHAALSLLPRLKYLDAEGVQHALLAAPVPLAASWPAHEGPMSGSGVDRAVALADRRNWISGLHGGTRAVVEGRITPAVEVAP